MLEPAALGGTMSIIGRRTALDRSAALGVQVLQRRTDIDFIQEFADDITAVPGFDFLAEHSEPETHGFIEDLNQHQPAREVWKRGEIDVVRKGHVGVSAFEAFPICADASQVRFQLPG